MERDSDKLPSPERESKLGHILWSLDEAQLVGKFLKGEDLSGTETSKTDWQELKTETPYQSVNECKELLHEAKRFVALLPHIEGSSERVMESTKETSEAQDQYEYVAKKRALTALEVHLETCQKMGLSIDDYRRFDAHSSTRDKDKKNFSQEEHFGASQLQTFLAAEEGGPDIVERIGIPPRATDRSDDRMRGSLIHEIGHVTRFITNRAIWEDKTDAAQEHGLKQNRANISESKALEERKYIGGFRVGSSQQGAESTGELLTATALSMQEKRTTTISDLYPYLYKRCISGIALFEKAIGKSIKNVTKINSDYFVARFALLHHVTQLIELGYGDIDAVSFAALSASGLVSLEKAPELIRLGIISNEKQQKISLMLKNTLDYLTSDELQGYQIP